MKRETGARLRTIAVCVALALGTVAAYGTLGRNGFVSLDDSHYITENPHVRQGLSADTVAWAFTTQTGNWHPLAWLSHMLDVELYGMDPRGHHATSLNLHLLTAILLFLVFQRMTAAFWSSAFVAAVFAVHPVHVESVAWAAERKDVLSALFWMLTLTAYVHYSERPRAGRYVLVMTAFALGLMAKPMLVTLPFVLLLLDYWPLNRLATQRPRFTPVRLLVEKLPLLALSIASSAVTLVVQQGSGAMLPVPLGLRLANASVSYVGYVMKMLWPTALAPLYPFPRDGLDVWKVAVCALVLVAATAGALYFGRSRRYLTVGWLWYAGTLVPVIGLIQVGYQASADRYLYIPSIGLTMLVAWGVAEAVARLRVPAAGVALLTCAMLLLLAWTTRVQVGHWRDTFTLCEHTIRVTEGNYVMYTNLGVAHARREEWPQAVAALRQSVLARPDFDHGHYNLANALSRLGRVEEAIHHYRRALDVSPGYVNAQLALGRILQSRGELDEAIEHD